MLRQREKVGTGKVVDLVGKIKEEGSLGRKGKGRGAGEP